MIQCLTRMREGHKSFALLYPYSIPLYRNLGWEIISNKMTYTIKDRQIPEKLHEPGYVRRVSWDDEEFHKLHSKFAEKPMAACTATTLHGKNTGAGMRTTLWLLYIIQGMMFLMDIWCI